MSLADRLAERTLELVDHSSPSRAEAELAAHVLDVLRDGGVEARDADDTCVVAGATTRGARPLVLLAGHLDTVPAQDNVPGRIDGDRVYGCGASDMKGALAVMIELTLVGAPFDCLFFGREELPGKYSALAPLLERERLEYELVVMMEPTANELHAGCVGNVNATWTFHGRSGHSARPWDADNAIHAAARGIASLADLEREEHVFDGLTFYEVASVTQIQGGIAQNVIPDRAEAVVNYRYAPGRTPEEAERRLAEVVGDGLEIFSNAPSGAVPAGNAIVDRLRAMGLGWEPKQAWTPVAEFALAGVDAVNFGPGEPRFAHTREEQVAIDALVRSYEVLEALWRD